jgi:hypothetical protein
VAGIEAEASPKVARGSRHRNERLWQRKAYDDGRTLSSEHWPLYGNAKRPG